MTPVVLVFRTKTCRQYPFFSYEDFGRWIRRKPFRDEIITVIEWLAGREFWRSTGVASTFKTLGGV